LKKIYILKAFVSVVIIVFLAFNSSRLSNKLEVITVEVQLDITDMYYSGFIVNENHEQAMVWFTVAATLGQVNAKKQREEIRKRMSVEVFKKSEALAYDVLIRLTKG